MTFRLKLAMLFGVGAAAFFMGFGAMTYAATWTHTIYGRWQFDGYFYNINDNYGTYVFPRYDPNVPSTTGCEPSSNSGDAIPSWVDNAYNFKNFILCKLNSNNPNTAIRAQERVGAAFIIQTMIGTSRTNPPSSAQITEWENMVDNYSQEGYVQWDATISYTVNSYYQGTNSGPNPVDDAFYSNVGSSAHVIVFHNPVTGKTYAIRRYCANTLGDTNIGPPGQISWSLGGTTTASKTSVYPLQSVTFTNQVGNKGPNPAWFDWGVHYCWNACSGGYSSGYSTHATGSVTSLSAGNVDTVNTWTYTIPSNITATKMCVWVSYTNSSGPNTGGWHSAMQCVNIIRPTTSCGSLTIPNQPIGPTDQYTLNSSVNVSGPTTTINSSNTTYYVEVSGPNVASNNNVPFTVGTNTLSSSYQSSPTNDAGVYTVYWGINSSATNNVRCGPQTFTVAYSPYFSVTGGGIAAGAGFGSNCSETSADIESWNDNTSRSPNFFGAGSEDSAIATGTITNFVSGMGLGPTDFSSQYGHGLSFANYSNSLSDAPTNYGGSFGTNSVPCLTDYYGTKSTAANVQSLLSTDVNASNLSSGNYSVGGPGETIYLNASLIPQGTVITIYAQGNVVITGNIGYSPYTLATIPRFNLYVEGNIYVQPSVTELHGVYTAQKNSTSGGDIVTCALLPTDVSEPYGACNQPLTVVGSMDAEGHLELTRTYGNLANVPGRAPAAPAETFEYNPELWLNALNGDSTNVKTYTSLPPVL